ncbi:helix-turn-helix domain-containing protein [Anaerosinus massiliensis]|uniref:helix-turn-helix domain-containing protein n=1 Tax=Massilibacillus massiliensis TaxID=1806837 RepID=UPI000DA5EBFE|nr:helix-turn-helix transcriptional regulator [Massilibacillus massiliensis]
MNCHVNDYNSVNNYELDSPKRKYSEFGVILKSAREAKGWTIIQLYMNVNQLSSKGNQIISYESLLRWERGLGIPQIESTVALARVLSKPEIIQLRIEAIELCKRKEKTACTAMQTVV